VIAAGTVAACCGTAVAQAGTQPGSPADVVVTTGDPRRDSLLKLMRPISLDQADTRLEDILAFIKDFSGAPLEPLWADDRNPEGLDRDKLVTVRVNNVTVLALLERVLAQAADGDLDENTWQLTEFGDVHLGPKSRLNRFKRVEIYDINDLLIELPTYDEVPLIDLQSVLQSSGGRGGGGGQSPFRDDQQQDDQDRQLREDKAQEIIDLIVQIVEPEQWQDGGGTGGSIRFWQGTLIVNAPDYMHRQLNGYTFWPRRLTNLGTMNGRRYVSLGTDNGVSRIDGFANQEVSAVAGGRIIRSGDPDPKR
jgi:hypothetical protein